MGLGVQIHTSVRVGVVRDIEQKSFGGELPQNKFCGDNPERFPERPGRPVAFDQIFLSNLFDNSRAFSRVLACCSKSWEGTPKKKSCVTGQLFARLACVLGVVWRPTWRRRFKRPNFFSLLPDRTFKRRENRTTKWDGSTDIDGRHSAAGRPLVFLFFIVQSPNSSDHP